MKGIELSKRFYLECGEPMLREQFGYLLDKISVGLVGGGSECLGYDDEISADHDFEPAFCIFLPDESVVDRKEEFALERAYSKLPREFMGYKRAPLDPVGGKRHGVIRISEFLREKTGRADGALSLDEWFFVPEQALLEATGGQIFFDGSKEMTRVRDSLAYLPEDVRLKKLAGELLVMGQAGQYNYARCVSRGDSAAAQLAIIEFSKSALHAIFLLCRRYMPYYKWCFRALRDVGELSKLYDSLEYLISSPNGELDVDKKQSTVDYICATLANELLAEGLVERATDTLEECAYAVNAKINDAGIRNLHLLFGV